MNTSDFTTTLLVNQTPKEADLPEQINGQDYHTSITVNATAQKVFNSINNVSDWWTADLEGSSQKQDDEFTVHFGNLHVSMQKVVELTPDEKIVWLVTDSNLSFIAHKNEWTNTTIRFEIASYGNQTEIHFTHIGLVPAVACYKSCVKGWDYYIKGSLSKLLTEGKGTPGLS